MPEEKHEERSTYWVAKLVAFVDSHICMRACPWNLLNVLVRSLISSHMYEVQHFNKLLIVSIFLGKLEEDTPVVQHTGTRFLIFS